MRDDEISGLKDHELVTSRMKQMRRAPPSMRSRRAATSSDTGEEKVAAGATAIESEDRADATVDVGRCNVATSNIMSACVADAGKGRSETITRIIWTEGGSHCRKMSFSKLESMAEAVSPSRLH